MLSFITADPSSLSSTRTTDRKILFGTLTGPSVPGEEEQKLGARDGDHLADVGVGPAGDLVPHPEAPWAQTVSKHADRLRKSVSRHSLHTKA